MNDAALVYGVSRIDDKRCKNWVNLQLGKQTEGLLSFWVDLAVVASLMEPGEFKFSLWEHFLRAQVTPPEAPGTALVIKNCRSLMTPGSGTAQISVPWIQNKVGEAGAFQTLMCELICHHHRITLRCRYPWPRTRYPFCRTATGGSFEFWCRSCMHRKERLEPEWDCVQSR